MTTARIHETDVLIAGAGPTGLVLALWLTRMGVRVRIVDKTGEPGTTSRALGVQARTLEFYRQMGIADEVVARGHRTEAVHLWVAGKRAARAVFGAMGAGISPYPYALTYPQDEHERMLIDHLEVAGVRVERQTELLGFEDTGTGVRARLKAPTGPEEVCEAAYLAGCDGAHSTVRQALQIGFPGGQYDHLFYVADVEASGEAMNGDLHVGLDKADFLAVFPLIDEGHARLIGTVRDEEEHKRETLSWNDVSKRVIEWMHIDVRRVNWFSTYRVHHRVADHFRKRRAFLLGDAAHIHSPVGAQGMNTGIGDAINLAWKLAAVVQGRAKENLLDSYEPERIAFARRLVATTDRAFVGVTSRGAIARLLRLKIVPIIFPIATSFAAVRRFFFRTISQTSINYRGSGLSQGHAGAIHGGDRLPWIRFEANSAAYADNFAPLASLHWQVHVYGEASPEIGAVCEERKLPLYVFPWHADMKKSGVSRNAVYLMRPDGYVGLAAEEGRSTAISSYLDKQKISPRG
jgi:2-polyprenyl-6-methoxyphenol hydroxylase-like FAD-dependent oxidoreductase